MAREHGTRARYVGGPDEHGQAGGCRCTPCTEANRADHERRARLILYGQWQPYVDAARAREHVRELSAAGIGWKRVAELAGLSSGQVSTLVYGRPRQGRPPSRRIRPATEQAILAVRPGPEALGSSALTDAAGTRRRLQALVALGYSQARLAGRLGMLQQNFAHVLTRDRVTAGTARAVRALYADLWDAAPDESTHRARVSVSRARNYARARDWPVPMAWDEEALDDPAGGPAEDWRRGGRTTVRAEDLVEDAEFVRQHGHQSLNERAMRLGVSRDRLEHAYKRAGSRQAQDEREAG